MRMPRSEELLVLNSALDVEYVGSATNNDMDGENDGNHLVANFFRNF